jgi:hypothetical protein
MEKVLGLTFWISAKVNLVEFQDDSATPGDCKLLCMKFEEYGVDLLRGIFEARAFEHNTSPASLR